MTFICPSKYIISPRDNILWHSYNLWKLCEKSSLDIALSFINTQFWMSEMFTNRVSFASFNLGNKKKSAGIGIKRERRVIQNDNATLISELLYVFRIKIMWQKKAICKWLFHRVSASNKCCQKCIVSTGDYFEE